MKFTLSILLLTLVIGGLLVFEFVMEQHRTQIRHTLDPAKISHYKYKNASLSEPDEKRIVFIGDSRISQWNNINLWPEFKEINRGIGGQTTAQILLRIEQDTIEIDADVVILQVGVNDLKALAFLPEEKNRVIENTKSNLIEIVKKFSESDVKLVVTTIIPPSYPQGLWRLFWDEAISSAVVDLNTFIMNDLREKCIVLELNDAFGGLDILPKKFAEDTLHLNQLGYEKLSKHVIDRLEF